MQNMDRSLPASFCLDAITARAWVKFLDNRSIRHYALASSLLRTQVCTALDVVVVIGSDQHWSSRSISATSWTAAHGAEPWAFELWCSGTAFPKLIDWAATTLRVALLEGNPETLQAVTSDLRMAFDFKDDVNDHVLHLGSSWAPISASHVADLNALCMTMRHLSSLWLDANALSAAGVDMLLALPSLRCVGLVGHPRSSDRLRCRTVEKLHISGTTPETLDAIADVAPQIFELEISPTEFVSDATGFGNHEDFQSEEEEDFVMHVAPDFAAFRALRRIQVWIDEDSRVLFGAGLKGLPSLERLGTVETACLHVVPPRLQELVVLVRIQNGWTKDLQTIQSTASLQCRCLHLCFTLDETTIFEESRVPSELRICQWTLLQCADHHLIHTSNAPAWCILSALHLVAETVLGELFKMCRTLKADRFSQCPGCLCRVPDSTPLCQPLPWYS